MPSSTTSSPTYAAHAQASSPLPAAVRHQPRPRPPSVVPTQTGSSTHRISHPTSNLCRSPTIPSARNASAAGSLTQPNGGRCRQPPPLSHLPSSNRDSRPFDTRLAPHRVALSLVDTSGMRFEHPIHLHTLAGTCRSRAALQLEILAIRQQLAVLNQTRPRRPHLRPVDRLFWLCLSKLWSGWRNPLIIVKPDTMVITSSNGWTGWVLMRC